MSCCSCCCCCCYKGKDERVTSNHVIKKSGGKGLGFTSGFSAILSLVIISIAIGTGEWLFTEEKLPKAATANASAEPDSRLTYSGLWRVCVAIRSNMKYECTSIDYFSNEEYLPDPSDSTMAIPYAVTKSAIFFFIATVLLVIAEICYFTAHVSHPRRQLCVFVAGVMFTVCGLLMLVSMIMYISVFKAEVGSKLRYRSSFQGPPYSYRYGFSFFLYLTGFITTEIAGTSAIFLYISWHQQDFGKNMRQKSYDDIYQAANNARRVSLHARQTRGTFLCERHQKRYFFGRETEDHIDFDEFLPPPSNIDCHDEYQREFPRDLTTQTISTTADVLHDEGTPSFPQHEFVSFDVEAPMSIPLSMQGSEWPIEAFRRTTPV